MADNRSTKIVKVDPTSFDDLPLEIVDHIAREECDTKSPSITGLFGINRTCHEFFKPALAKKLLEYVLQGNKEKVLAMAKINPSYFFIKATAQDYAMDLDGNKRTIEGWSAYQALFGTGDVDMLAAVKPHLDTYLATLADGHELAHDQEQEKFPNGFDYPASTYDFSELVAAMTADQQLRQSGVPNPATVAALAKSREGFKPGSLKVGHHFNMNDFIKAHEVYNQNWDPWNGNQLAFFSVNIIGFLERLLPAHYLQAACQGLINYVDVNGNPKQALSRSFKVMNYVTDKNIAVAPLDKDPSCRLGLGFFVNSHYGYAWDYEPRTRLPSRWKSMLSKYSEAIKTYAHNAETCVPKLRDSVK